MPLVNQSAFASLHDVSRKTVTKWKERGWLVFEGDQVDVDASNLLLKKYRAGGVEVVTPLEQGNKQGNKQETRKKTVTPLVLEAGESAQQAAERIISAVGAKWDFDEARRVKENYLALLNQLEYDTKSGAVVLAADVAAVVGTEYAKVRTRLLAIPAEQAPRLHRLKTVNEVQDALQEMITDALEELTNDGGA